MNSIREDICDLVDKSKHNLALNFSKLANVSDDPKKNNLIYQEFCKFSLRGELEKTYSYAFNKNKDMMGKRLRCKNFEIKSISKVLLGLGNASVYEFGLNLNYPWGVPYISGSTLKGLASSYLAINAGENWYRDTKTGKKSQYQVELFGGKQKDEVESYIGSVIFHDAWLVPTAKSWFTRDITNVHNKQYYSGDRLPDGTEDPVPIYFLALDTDLNFCVFLEGDTTATAFIQSVLLKALFDEGIGAKTAVGYGRFEKILNEDDLDQLFENFTNDELLDKLEKNTKNKRYSDSFYRQAKTRELNAALLPLYLKFSPLKALRLKLQNGELSNFELFGKECNRMINALDSYCNKFPDKNVKTLEEAQKIFDYVMLTFNPSSIDRKKIRLLKSIEYSWEDMKLNEDTIVDYIVEYSDNLRIWPPLEALKVCLDKLSISDEDKQDYINDINEVVMKAEKKS